MSGRSTTADPRRHRRESVPGARGDTVREALAGLTVRGRAFLAAGVTAIVCAVLLGQAALTRVGVLVLALPLVTAALRRRAAATGSRWCAPSPRSWSPPASPRGSSSPSPTRAGRPAGCCCSRTTCPTCSGTRPRFVLEGIGHGWRRHVSYQVRSDVRGRFEIGPMTVRVTDPFGLVELGRAFQHHGAADRHAAHGAAARRSRSAAPGPAPATTGRGRSPPAAPRTSPSASTAAATTCAGCTGAARRASAS